VGYTAYENTGMCGDKAGSGGGRGEEGRKKGSVYHRLLFVGRVLNEEKMQRGGETGVRAVKNRKKRPRVGKTSHFKGIGGNGGE